MSHMSQMSAVGFAYAVELGRKGANKTYRNRSHVRYTSSQPTSKKKKAAKIGAFLWFFGIGL